MRRVLLKAAVAIALVAAIVALGGYLYLRRSLPQMNGTTKVNGLSAPVDIIRDADAIPHIFAANKADGLFGLGYAHAQDRLWQMELQRRIGHGRLSEVLGPAALPQDRFLRTVGFGRAAKTAWASTPDWAKQQIDAYVAGVNAFLSTHHGSALPPEFTLLRFAPEPFDGADVVVWQKMMAWDLSGNYSFELLRRDLAARLGEEALAELMPPYPPDGLSILPPLTPPIVARTVARGAQVAQGFNPASQTACRAGTPPARFALRRASPKRSEGGKACTTTDSCPGSSEGPRTRLLPPSAGS